MKLGKPEYVPCDVLVIGGGGAGLRAAAKARETGCSVILVSKSPAGLGNNTALSKAAFSVVTGKGDARDTADVLVQDTLEGGRFINDRRLVARMSRRIASEVPFLEECGISFEKSGERTQLSRSPGHSYARHLHVVGRQGTSITVPMKQHCARTGVDLRDRVFITRLLARDGRSVGAVGFDREGRVLVFTAGATVLAAGGLGQVYRYTNNAVGMTGDGHALAFRAGLSLRDMEFVQFYPTSVGGTRMLLYEAFVLRSSGRIVNSRGEDVVKKHGLEDPMAMTRDRLTRAIQREIDSGNQVLMDFSSVPAAHLEKLRSLLPPEAQAGKTPVAAMPCAHFAMGGVVTDDEARTALPGLFACGEVVGGTHGANRLAGNAIAEILAMGSIAGENAALLSRQAARPAADTSEVAAEVSRLESLFGKGTEPADALVRSLKEIMWGRVGIIRKEPGLQSALKELAGLLSRAGGARAEDAKGLAKCLELHNMLLVADMIAHAALERRESRGAHYRDDYPEERPEWQASLWIVNRDGKMVLEKKAV